MKFLRNLIGMSNSRYIQLVLYKVYADLAAEAERFYVGYLWWFLEPLFEMVVYFVVFGLLLKRATPDFVPFLLIGLVLWKWFLSSVVIGSNSILGNRGLLFQVYVPKILFPVTAVVANTIKFVIVCFVLVVFLVLYGFPPALSWFSLPLILIPYFVFICAVSFLSAALIPFYKDLKIVIDSGLKLLFFASAIFFPISTIPEKYHIYLAINPVAVFIDETRTVLMTGAWPDFDLLFIHGAVSLIVFGFVTKLIYVLDHKFPKVV